MLLKLTRVHFALFSSTSRSLLDKYNHDSNNCTGTWMIDACLAPPKECQKRAAPVRFRARRGRFIYTRAGPPEGIISHAEIVSQLHRREPCLVKDPTFVTEVVVVVVLVVADVAVGRHPILFLSPRRKDFESLFHPPAPPAASGRYRARNALRKSQKSIFCRRRPRLISRPISRACNAAYFYPWPTSARRSAASLLLGHSRNRTRKKKARCMRETREDEETCKPISSVSHSTRRARSF